MIREGLWAPMMKEEGKWREVNIHSMLSMCEGEQPEEMEKVEWREMGGMSHTWGFLTDC